jgi:hypothetical protein
MLRRIIRKLQWADNNIMMSILKVLYYNIFKINRFVIFEFDLTQTIKKLPIDSNRFTVTVMGYNELDTLIAGENDLPREFGMYGIDGVRYCVVIREGDQLGHISWLYLKGDKNRWFNLGADEAHVNYSFTYPEFRGLAFFPHALLASAEWLKARNYRRILMDVHEETTFMLNSMKKIDGVKHIGLLNQWFLYRPKFRKGKPTV